LPGELVTVVCAVGNRRVLLVSGRFLNSEQGLTTARVTWITLTKHNVGS
jgi:hypothetical protein